VEHRSSIPACWLGFQREPPLRAFLGHLEDWSAGALAEDWISERALVIIIGFLLAISLCALVSTMTVTSRWRADTPA
jgi:hypothetical protein